MNYFDKLVNRFAGVVFFVVISIFFHGCTTNLQEQRLEAERLEAYQAEKAKRVESHRLKAQKEAERQRIEAERLRTERLEASRLSRERTLKRNREIRQQRSVKALATKRESLKIYKTNKSAIIESLKESMHNPERFEYIDMRVGKSEPNYTIIIIRFRGENAFGALRIGEQKLQINKNGSMRFISSK